MIYQCINCEKQWGNNNNHIDEISHGLCKKCAKEKMIPYYRKQQIKEGNFDCFAKSDGYCDQSNCCYRYLCL